MRKSNRSQAALTENARVGKPKATPVVAAKTSPRRETTRAGKVMVSGWLPLEARSSFRLIQAQQPEKLMQDLIAEAFNDLFAKYNVPQTANLNRSE